MNSLVGKYFVYDKYGHRRFGIAIKVIPKNIALSEYDMNKYAQISVDNKALYNSVKGPCKVDRLILKVRTDCYVISPLHTLREVDENEEEINHENK